MADDDPAEQIADERPKKILIVDDVQFNITALLIILEYSIELADVTKVCDTASNGEEAFQRVKDDVEKNGGKFCSYNLILMDCNMPFVDGYEATTMIRNFLFQQELDQPIISAVTGHTE